LIKTDGNPDAPYPSQSRILHKRGGKNIFHAAAVRTWPKISPSSTYDGFRFMKFPLLLPLTAAVALLAGPSCTGWPRGWQQAKALNSRQGPAGAWTGTWHSIPTGHTGKLRCAVFPKKGQRWEYRYRASWARVLCAGFTVDCEATPSPDGRWQVMGQKDLGPLFGGVFTHKGTVAGDHMEATYQAAADHGTLTLRRLEEIP
jgi:hypothetical protein